MEWSPLLAGALAIIGTLLGVLIQGRLTLKSKKLDASVAHTSRTREWRRDVYIRLVEAIDRAERGIGRAWPDKELSLTHAEPSLSKEEGGRLKAEVLALGSIDMTHLVDEFEREHFAFYILLGDTQELIQQGDRAADERKELRQKRDRIHELAGSIEAQVRTELQGEGG